MQKQELHQVHFIRAIAALAVTVFHLYCGNGNLFVEPSTVKSILSYGYLGVELFFLLSGFIICYALPRDYIFKRDVKTFLLKRFVRIEPPYVLSIVAIIILNKIAQSFNAIPFSFSFSNFLLHLGYLNNWGFGEYYNVVYWTLGIEFQFYLLIALLFPLLNSRSNTALWFVFIFLFLLSFVDLKGVQVIFSYLPIFCTGFLVFLYRFKKSISLPVYLLTTTVFLALIWYKLNFAAFACIIAGLFVLFFWKLHHPIIHYLSKISFSLYLTHVLIGGKTINLGLRFVEHDYERYLLFCIALGISIISAHFFFLMIGEPALQLAKRFQ